MLPMVRQTRPGLPGELGLALARCHCVFGCVGTQVKGEIPSDMPSPQKAPEQAGLRSVIAQAMRTNSHILAYFAGGHVSHTSSQAVRRKAVSKDTHVPQRPLRTP